MSLYEQVLLALSKNEGFTSILALLVYSFNDGVEFPTEKLIGDWSFIWPGQRIAITYSDPFRIEHGFLFTLPGFESNDVLKGGIVQIPRMSENENAQTWQVFKHVALFADTIEMEDSL